MTQFILVQVAAIFISTMSGISDNYPAKLCHFSSSGQGPNAESLTIEYRKCSKYSEGHSMSAKGCGACPSAGCAITFYRCWLDNCGFWLCVRHLTDIMQDPGVLTGTLAVSCQHLLDGLQNQMYYFLKGHLFSFIPQAFHKQDRISLRHKPIAPNHKIVLCCLVPTHPQLDSQIAKWNFSWKFINTLLARYWRYIVFPWQLRSSALIIYNGPSPSHWQAYAREEGAVYTSEQNKGYNFNPMSVGNHQISHLIHSPLTSQEIRNT